MKVIAIHGAGGPETLVLEEREKPEATYRHLLIKVHATAVNRADIMQRMGFYPAPAGCVKDVPGLEFVGQIQSLGPGCHLDHLVGDRVMGLMPGGTYQEYLTIDESLVLPIPEQYDFIKAAAIPEAYITAFDALVLQGGMRPGHRVLVSAAASSVGVAAAQLIKAWHGTGIGTTRNAQKLTQLADLYDKAIVCKSTEINGRTLPGFAPGVRSYLETLSGTANGALDLVLELAGGDYIEESLDLMTDRGIIVLVGLLAGRTTQLSINKILSKRISLIGTTLRARSLAEKAGVVRAFEKQVLPLFARGLLDPVVDKVFRLDQAGEAHAYLESNANIGKVVLEV